MKFLVVTTYTTYRVEIDDKDINTVEDALSEARRIHEEDVDASNGFDKIYSVSPIGKTVKLLETN